MLLPSRRSVLLAISALLLLSCSKPPSQRFMLSAPASDAHPPVRSLDPSLTKKLFETAVRPSGVDKESRFELHDDGILIHPGGSKPTSATFRLTPGPPRIHAYLFIQPLNAEGLRNPRAGTVNVELRAGGALIYRSYFDRNTEADIVLNTADTRQLTVIVDNADGNAWWDWFCIRFEAEPRVDLPS